MRSVGSYSRQSPKFYHSSALRSPAAKLQDNDLEYQIQLMGIPNFPAKLMTKQEGAEQYCECIGVIRSEWIDERTKEIKSICYGTAFAVSKRLLITCAHNVHNEEANKTADRCLFIPNHVGYVLEDTVKYHTAKGVFCRYIPLKKEQNLSSCPTPNQICVLVIKEDVVITNKYISIGLCDVKPNEPIEIIGYPSRQFSAKLDILSVKMRRRATKGQVESIRGRIEQGEFMVISYNLKTKKGMSGSPILYSHKGKMLCVGIHTHGREEGVKSGVFFNRFALRTIRRFEQELAEQYKITSKIQFCFFEEQEHQRSKWVWESQEQHYQIISPYSSQLHGLKQDRQFDQIYFKIKRQIQSIIKPWLYDAHQPDPSRVIKLTNDDLILFGNQRMKFLP